MTLMIYSTDKYVIVVYIVSGMENSHQGAKQNTEHKESTRKKYKKHLIGQHNPIARALKYSNFNFVQNAMPGLWDTQFLATDLY